VAQAWTAYEGEEMSRCTLCGSFAINQHAHGRVRGKYTGLCDVCYWRADYAILKQECERLRSALTEISAMQSHECTIGQNLKDAVRVARDALSAKP
jgi:hypothetical protein